MPTKFQMLWCDVVSYFNLEYLSHISANQDLSNVFNFESEYERRKMFMKR